MHRPISVSYILISYNHEKYIIEAVQSALSQSYAPMEILITDDCSQDQTYELIYRECSKYQGANTVLINRNKSRLGIVRHFNKAIEMTKGDLVIVASGDDISRLDRTKRIVDQWRNGKKLAIGCNPEIINQEGETIGRFYSRSIPKSFAWQDIIIRRNAALFLSAIDRKIISEWGALDESLLMEDQTIPFRAALMQSNAIDVIDAPLAKYRFHDRSLVANYHFQTPGKSHCQVFINKLLSLIKSHQSWFEDLYKADYEHILKKEKIELLTLLANRISLFTYLKKIISAKSFSNRLSIWRSARKGKSTRGHQSFFLLASTPFPLFTVFLASIFFRFKNILRGQVRGY